jgi:hypothetical protein
MNRFTKADEKGNYIVSAKDIDYNPAGCSGEAINRLGRFEDFYDALLADMDSIPKELDRLRSSGREKSYRYKELMGRKLTVSYVLNLLKDYKI